MATPTISKKQERKTLSAKKGKRKRETIKNVLAQPFQTYWPQLKPEDAIGLSQSLQELPRIKPERTPVLYSEIKAIPKAERKQFRMKYLKKQDEIKKSNVENLVFGVNNVSSLILAGKAGAVLVASDVKPRLLVQHVIDQAVLHRAPILVVENLRQILLDNCGISSVVVAIQKSADGNLGRIRQRISYISQLYPIPQHHIHSQRLLTASEEISHEETPMDSQQTDVKKSSTSDNDRAPTDVFLRRQEGSKSRVFVPSSSNKRPTEGPCTETNIGFSGNDPRLQQRDVNRNIEPPVVVNHRALAVRRLKGDPDRTKRVYNASCSQR